MKYRKLYPYKYQLTEDCTTIVPIELEEVIDHRFIALSMFGLITIRKGYAWDGPSGPTIDTDTFIEGSLVHDALYQLIRTGLLPYHYKKEADVALRSICINKGMNRFRAWYVYQAVKYFGDYALYTKYASKRGEILI